MLIENSQMKRIFIGKTLGFIIGLSAFFLIPHFMPDASQRFLWAFFLWYITFGAIIGAFGTMAKFPVINISMPWWFRGLYVGGWLNFVIALFAYDDLLSFMISFFGADSPFANPYLFILEGCFIGLVIDFFATRYAGDGIE